MRSSRICCRPERRHGGTSAGRYYAVVEESLISPGMGRGRKTRFEITPKQSFLFLPNCRKCGQSKLIREFGAKDIAVVFAREGAKGVIADLNQKRPMQWLARSIPAESAPFLDRLPCL